MNPETPTPPVQTPSENPVPPAGDQPPMPQAPMQQPTPPKSDGNKMLIIVAVVIVAVLLVGAGVVALMSGDSDEGSSESTSSTSLDSTTSSSDSSSADEADVKSGEVSATIADMAFSPSELTVKKGSTVTWTNNDSVKHSVVSDSDSDKSGLEGPLLAKGETYSFTFDELGVYSYHCVPHTNMTATVTVVE